MEAVFWSILMPHLWDILATLITVAITFSSVYVKRWTGVQIEAKHREALHSAILTGAKVAVREGPEAARDMLINKATAYVKASVPDAIRALVPDSVVLQKLVERYLDDVINQVL